MPARALLAAISESEVIVKILDELGLPSEAPHVTPGHTSPHSQDGRKHWRSGQRCMAATGPARALLVARSRPAPRGRAFIRGTQSAPWGARSTDHPEVMGAPLPKWVKRCSCFLAAVAFGDFFTSLPEPWQHGTHATAAMRRLLEPRNRCLGKSQVDGSTRSSSCTVALGSMCTLSFVVAAVRGSWVEQHRGEG